MGKTSGGGEATTADRPGSQLELLESKLRPPQLRSGTVSRTTLLETLETPGAPPIISISAPPGYGKTTLLTQWTSRSRRAFAWVSLDDLDNDPVVLLGSIAGALDRVLPLDPVIFDDLVSGASVATVLSRLGAALAGMEHSFVLVLDDLHALTNQQSLDAIDGLVDLMPPGSQLVLCGRAVSPGLLATLRAQRRVREIGPSALRMNASQAKELLRAADVELSDAELAELLEHTEGWPAGLYLAALATRGGDGTRLKDTTAFRGNDRFVADYLRAELFPGLPAGELRFLTRTAVLERMCGPLCDAVLESQGSEKILDSLERSNLFVVALDRTGCWYRYHHLFQELLQAELARAEPELTAALLSRAATWCEENGEPEAAVGYAQEAGDVERVAALVTAHGQSAYQRGHAVTVERWLDWLEQNEGLEKSPLIAALGAWYSAIRGHPDSAERWMDWAQRGVMELEQESDREQVQPWLDLLRSSQCQQGMETMQADAQRALDGFGRASPHWPTAAFLLALSHRFSGEGERADDLFADIAEAAIAAGARNAASIALAERAFVAIERGDWLEAEAHAEKGNEIMRRARMEDYPPNVSVYAASARVAIHRDEHDRASEHLAKAQRMRPQLTHIFAPYSIQVRVELARAYTARADVAGARTLLHEAGALLRRGPDFGTLGEQVGELRAQLDSAELRVPGASTLTTAELRLLPLLATHLTFREIGERLYLSRHTVKSHAISAYRKLDVTSRNDAVERARELGLL
jgi:LuxR family transcriptional regulator, maltose regulon positive regulatory protein